MNKMTEQSQDLADSLAEGIAAIMAADEELSRAEDLADLFLDELNRLWADPEPLQLS
ncbi:MAG: hypothetical protein ABIQ30_07010 [Devosia sp.]